MKKILLLSILLTFTFGLSALPFFNKSIKTDKDILKPFYSLSEMPVDISEDFSLFDFSEMKYYSLNPSKRELTKDQLIDIASNMSLNFYMQNPDASSRQAKDHVREILKMNGYIQ